jgi:hypothetical protein
VKKPPSPEEPKTARDETGSVTVFVVGAVFALLMVAGLVFDGGSIIAGHRTADTEAQGAARAAAEQLFEVTARTGNPTIDPTAAQTAVNTYLASFGDTGTATVTGASVTVTVTLTVDMQILSAVGVGPRTIKGTATAVGLVGNNNGVLP